MKSFTLLFSLLVLLLAGCSSAPDKNPIKADIPPHPASASVLINRPSNMMGGIVKIRVSDGARAVGPVKNGKHISWLRPPGIAAVVLDEPLYTSTSWSNRKKVDWIGLPTLAMFKVEAGRDYQIATGFTMRHDLNIEFWPLVPSEIPFLKTHILVRSNAPQIQNYLLSYNSYPGTPYLFEKEAGAETAFELELNQIVINNDVERQHLIEELGDQLPKGINHFVSLKLLAFRLSKRGATTPFYSTLVVTEGRLQSGKVESVLSDIALVAMKVALIASPRMNTIYAGTLITRPEEVGDIEGVIRAIRESFISAPLLLPDGSTTPRSAFSEKPSAEAPPPESN